MLTFLLMVESWMCCHGQSIIDVVFTFLQPHLLFLSVILIHLPLSFGLPLYATVVLVMSHVPSFTLTLHPTRLLLIKHVCLVSQIKGSGIFPAWIHMSERRATVMVALAVGRHRWPTAIIKHWHQAFLANNNPTEIRTRTVLVITDRPNAIHGFTKHLQESPPSVFIQRIVGLHILTCTNVTIINERADVITRCFDNMCRRVTMVLLIQYSKLAKWFSEGVRGKLETGTGVEAVFSVLQHHPRR